MLSLLFMVSHESFSASSFCLLLAEFEGMGRGELPVFPLWLMLYKMNPNCFLAACVLNRDKLN